MKPSSKSTQYKGRIVIVPFGAENVQNRAVTEYRQLLRNHGPEDILILTSAPTSAEIFQDLISNKLPDTSVPRVTSPIIHATDVFHKASSQVVLSEPIQQNLLHRFLNHYTWNTNYLQHASTQPSFNQDVARLMSSLKWRDHSPETTPELQEIATALKEFHEWLAEHNHIEHGQLIAKGIDILSNADSRDEIIDAQAILCIEFEEFFALDRHYLKVLSEERELTCIAELDSSVRRTRLEPGPITNYVSFTDERTATASNPTTRPAATATYLSQGTVPADPEAGNVTVLPTESYDEQLTTVANEIERLCTQADWDYSDIVVGVKQTGSTLTEAIQGLEKADIPTDSTTVIGFGDDPAVRELLAVVQYLVADDENQTLKSRLEPPLDTDLLSSIQSMDGLEAPLRRWATESNLKERVARKTSALDARAQFKNVRQVFRMAAFVEDTDFLDATWRTFETVLKRAHEYAPQQAQTGATDRTAGVRVDHLQALKNESFRATFILNLIDEEYPGTPSLSQLFPDERIARMPDYPGVTHVTNETIDRTYQTNSTESSRPFTCYYTEHARRLLSIGADTTSDRLYLCLYNHEDTALEEQMQPSRFLAEVYRTVPWISELEGQRIRNGPAAEEYILSRIDDALTEIRRAQSQDVTVSLDELEADFGEVQQLLDASGEHGERLREALHARINFAEGRVRRD